MRHPLSNIRVSFVYFAYILYAWEKCYVLCELNVYPVGSLIVATLIIDTTE